MLTYCEKLKQIRLPIERNTCGISVNRESSHDENHANACTSIIRKRRMYAIFTFIRNFYKTNQPMNVMANDKSIIQSIIHSVK